MAGYTDNMRRLFAPTLDLASCIFVVTMKTFIIQNTLMLLMLERYYHYPHFQIYYIRTYVFRGFRNCNRASPDYDQANKKNYVSSHDSCLLLLFGILSAN
jgi:hypothetical protein